ncbi:MAG: hypothetical protein ACE149_17615 [Armatimonadota bacterium]
MDAAYLRLAEILRWPFFAGFALWLFRKPISELVSRVTRVKAPGAEISTVRDQERASVPDVPAQKPSQRSIEEAVEELAKEFPRELWQAADNHQSLMRELATYKTWYHFERVYKTIFGSQFRILQELESSTDGASEAELYPYYEEAVPEDMAYPFPRYLAFLVGQGLVERSPEGQCHITPLGIDFLIYTRALNYTQYKPF